VKRVVLDASALMTFFLGRPGAEKVKELLTAAAEGKKELLISAVNWGEVYYSIWRDRGRADAERAIACIAQLEIEVVAADMALAKVAAEFRVEHKLPYADSFAAALAHERKAILVTSDSYFAAVQEQIGLLMI